MNVEPGCHCNKGKMQWCGVESTCVIVVLINSASFPSLCDFRRVISLICAWCEESITIQPAAPTSQAGGAPAAKAVRSSWPGPNSCTMKYPLCNLYSTFPKHGDVAQPSSEQRGSSRQRQQATLSMFGKNKIKQQSSLEQERFLKRVLPGNVSSCFLPACTRACHGAKQATPPAPGESWAAMGTKSIYFHVAIKILDSL